MVFGNEVQPKPEPKFEVGKRYCTRGGNKALIDNHDGPYLLGRLVGSGKPIDRWSWLPNGRINDGPPDSPYDLMPGAIEVEPERAPHSNVTDRLAALEQAIARIEDCFTTEEPVIKRRLTDLGHKADGAHLKVKALAGDVATLIETVSKRLAAIEVGLELVNARLPDTTSTVDLGTGKLIRNHPDLPECGNPACGQCYTPKRIIKGGWINVYMQADGRATYGATYRTKTEADKEALPGRKACIKAGDIIEGEGL